MRSRRLAAGALALVWSLSSPRAALADEAPADPAARARALYAEGLERLEKDDARGAITAFEKAYALRPAAVILYNVAVAHIALDQPVEAVRALEAALAGTPALRAARAEQARALLAAQLEKVGTLTVTCNEEGADVFVDGVAVGKTPLAAPIRVAAGRHSVTVRKGGFEEQRQSLDLAAGKLTTLATTLSATPVRSGWLRLSSQLPGTDVFVGDQWVGRTPLAGTVALQAGSPQRIELRRQGYLTAAETVTAAEGQEVSVTLTPVEDKGAVVSLGSALDLQLAQPDATVSIDGVRRLVRGGPIAIAPGVHDVVVEREGYHPVSLRTVVAEGAPTVLNVDLPLTESKRSELIGDAESVRRAGISLTVVGGVLVGAAIPLLIWGNSERVAGEEEQSRRESVFPCGVGQTNANDCFQFLKEPATQVDLGRGLMGAAGAGAAVGLGLGITGVVLLATGESPERYQAPATDELARRLQPLFAVTPTEVFLGLAGEL